MTRFGATPDEWDRITALCKEDVLPSLCNPTLATNPRTERAAAEYAKTPSRVVETDGIRCGAGIKDWPTRPYDARSIAKWRKDPDNGCGLRGRLFRAIDIDTPDEKIALRIQSYCNEFLGVTLPCRYRKDSGKRLLMYRLEHPEIINKRVLPVRRKHNDEQGDYRGIVEFLFDKQFFMVFGRHPDGAFYRWNGELEDAPVLELEDIADLYDAMIVKFGPREYKKEGVSWEKAKGSVSAQLTKPRSSEDVSDDPIVNYLYDHTDLVLGTDYTGAIRLHCPYEHDSGKYGGTSTVYFPKGVGGMTHGGFKCLHASCQDKTLPDFLHKIKYTMPESEITPVMTVDEYIGSQAEIDTHFQRNKSGKIEGTMTNYKLFLLDFKDSPISLRFDSFKQQLLIRGVEEFEVPYDDKHAMGVLVEMERYGFAKTPTTEQLRTILRNAPTFDSAQLWLDSVQWDGVPRLRTFHVDCLRVENTPYHKHVVQFMFSAIVGRIINPGCKVDMVPLLISGEGIRKTTFAQAMAFEPEAYTVIDLQRKEDDICRMLQGRVICELDELRGMSGRDAESVRSIISRQNDSWVPKFKESTTHVPRRSIFIGTSNRPRPLDSAAENRRWLPVRLMQEIDSDYLMANRDQLYAEAKEHYKVKQVQYKLVHKLATNARLDAQTIDPWTSPIKEFLVAFDANEENKGLAPTTVEILRNALDKSKSSVSNADAYRVSNIMNRLGYVQNNEDEWTSFV